MNYRKQFEEIRKENVAQAGVMFTSDPAGDPGNIHVNASYGLGEAVVSGIVSPDEYICDRSGNALKVTIGSKECKINENRKALWKTHGRGMGTAGRKNIYYRHEPLQQSERRREEPLGRVCTPSMRMA